MANKPNHPWGPDSRLGPAVGKRKRESISIINEKDSPISAAHDRLRHTWNIHRSVNHRYGGYQGGYIGGTVLPEEELSREQGADE